MTATRLLLAAVVSTLTLAVGEAFGRELPQSVPQAYVDASAHEAVRLAGKHARVSEVGAHALAEGGYVVCGTLDTGGELLPFATLWRAGEPVGDGATLLALTKAKARKFSHGEAYQKSISSVCRGAGLSSVMPVQPQAR